MALLALLALAAGGSAIVRRAPPWLDVARGLLAVVLVAESAIGLALVAGGAGPTELLHWLYAAVAVAALVLAGAVPPDAPPRQRAAGVVAAAILALVMVWRLTATG
jgi:hypothetical protein